MNHFIFNEIQAACVGMGKIAFAEYTKQKGGSILPEDRSRLSFVADELRPSPESVLNRLNGINWGDSVGIDSKGSKWVRSGTQTVVKGKLSETFISYDDGSLHELITFETNESSPNEWSKLVYQEYGKYRNGYKRRVAWVKTSDELWHEVAESRQTRIVARLMKVRKPRFKKN